MFLNVTYYTGEISLVAKDFAFATFHKVTYELDGEVYDTKNVTSNRLAENISIAGYDIIWKLDGELYDFDTPVTKDITLVGERTLKAIRLTEDSFMTTGGESKYDIEYGEDGSVGMITPQAPASSANVAKAIWKADLTVEDIEVIQGLGYTHLTFAVKADNFTNTSARTCQIMNNTLQVSLAKGEWTPVEVTLEQVKAYLASTTSVFLNVTYYTGEISLVCKDFEFVTLS